MRSKGNSFIALILLLVVSVIIATNWQEPKPDLKQLYAQSNEVMDQPPVVFIHGMLGSKLRDKNTHEEVWLGSAYNLLFGNHDNFAPTVNLEILEIELSNYEAYGLTKKTVGQDFYGNILKTLSAYGGYEEAVLGQKVERERKYFYTFVYDWRQDNVETVKQLAQFIEQIRKDYDDPNLKVDIIAHSMGGLIARYYLRYGVQDVLNSNDFPVNLYGAERLRRVILLGTPNLGSIKQVKSFINGAEIVFGDVNPEAMITFPSLYQLLPHPLNNWIVDQSGNPLSIDLFDIETWKRFEWGIYSPDNRKKIMARFDSEQEAIRYLDGLERFVHKTLERARRFVWSLTVNLPEEHPTLVVFGGDCSKTSARILLEKIDDVEHVRLTPEEIENPSPSIDYERLLFEPGDGVVTKASLLGRDVLDPSIPRHKYSFFPLDHAILLCEAHRTLTNNINFQNNLLNALLVRD